MARLGGYFDIACVILIWSGFILVSRFGGRGALLPYDVVALRFGTAALVLTPIWLLRRRLPLLRPKILALALTGGIGYSVFVYIGFRGAPAAHAGILLPGLLPFETAIFSRLLLDERITRRRAAGLAVIALGVLCLGVDTFSAGMSAWPGDAAFVCASSLWALYSVLLRRWNIPAWDATIGSALMSALLYLPVYALLLPKHLLQAEWSTIGLQAFYQGIMAVIVAMILYVRAVASLGPSKVGLFMALVPVIASLLAVPVLSEPLTSAIVLGLLLTSAGAWLGTQR